MTKLVALIALLASCAGDEVERAIVEPIQAPCRNFVTATLCPRFAVDGKETELARYGILGYEPRWGVESEITLHRESPDRNAPPDLMELLVLDEIIAETPVAVEPFDLQFARPLIGYPTWFGRLKSPLDMGGTDVLCEQSLCDQIIELNGGMTVTMELVDESTLRATAVTPD